MAQSFLADTNPKIFLAGRTGMVGSAIYKALITQGFDSTNLLSPPRNQLDLQNQSQVESYFSRHRPTTVILAAAKVGGIGANRSQPFDFLIQNLLIQNNIFNACFNYNVHNICFLGSSCMYPPSAVQPFKEEALLTAPFEITNEAYALSKVAGLKACEYLRCQYGFNAFTVIPNNSYGPNDNYDSTQCHVIPSMIQKVYTAIEHHSSSIECWGSGNPLRDFIYVDDIADAIIFLLKSGIDHNEHSIYNITHGSETSIRDLICLISELMGYTGDIIWNHTKPDGMYRKTLDNSRILSMGWKSRTSLSSGLKLAIADYINRFI